MNNKRNLWIAVPKDQATGIRNSRITKSQPALQNLPILKNGDTLVTMTKAAFRKLFRFNTGA